ncbi:hypothetical protein BKA70DRAFT_1438538 [Coprinopsis sp. MPI-PUGE-AT-0042]|nr:hypothetical protein BKA70DRAFT_1438538 [Coprinopsis sp. MPI-PUGE-AT-0042]
MLISAPHASRPPARKDEPSSTALSRSSNRLCYLKAHTACILIAHPFPSFPVTMSTPMGTTGAMAYISLVNTVGTSMTKTFEIPLAPDLTATDPNSHRQSLAALYGSTLHFQTRSDDVTVREDSPAVVADPAPSIVTEEDQPAIVPERTNLHGDTIPHTSTFGEAEGGPSLPHVVDQVEAMARKIVLVAIVQGHACSVHKARACVSKALSQPDIIDLLYQHYHPSGMTRSYAEDDFIRNPRVGQRWFSVAIVRHIRIHILEPLSIKLWDESLRPFLASAIEHTISWILTNKDLFPDLSDVAYSPPQLRGRLWWYASGGGYLHVYGIQDENGIPYMTESEFNRHVPARFAHAIAVALSHGEPIIGKRPFVLHFRHGAVVQTFRFMIHSIAEIDPTVLKANRGNMIEVVKLAASLLSAVLYKAWDRGTLDITADDVLQDRQAQDILSCKLETIAAALESRRDFMPQKEIQFLEDAFEAPAVDVIGPLPQSDVESRALFLCLAIPQPSLTLRVYQGEVFVPYQELQLAAVVHDRERDDGPADQHLFHGLLLEAFSSFVLVETLFDGMAGCSALKHDLKKTLAEVRSSTAAKRGRTNSNVDGQPPRKKWFENGADLEIDQYPRATVQPQGSSDQNQTTCSSSTGDSEGEQLLAPAPLPAEEGRGKHVKSSRHLLVRYRDFLPGRTTLALDPSLAKLSENPSPPIPDLCTAAPPLPSPEVSAQHTIFQAVHITEKNEFGLYKRFQTPEPHPYDPEASLNLQSFCNPPPREDDPFHPDNYYPFPNRNAFLLGEWRASDDNGKGRAGFAKLLQIIGSPDWNPTDVCGIDWAKIDNALASSVTEVDVDDAWVDESAWRTSTVSINVPFNEKCSAPGPFPYEVQFRHRPIIPMMRDRIMNLRPEDQFHFLPHELRWNPAKGKVDIPESPPEGGCNLPRYIVGLMFGSDETVLAQFGTAKLWPLYMSYANDSKYRRAKLGLRLVEHLAYLSRLPDDFKDFYITRSGHGTLPAPLITYCQRELFHEQWKIILDDEFMQAFDHGIVIRCLDGVERRFYPRIFTYSADYPEKIIVASIRLKGTCPCPVCLIPLDKAHNLGMANDRLHRETQMRQDNPARQAMITEARRLIYDNNRSVNCKAVDRKLRDMSLVPTQNAFSERFSSRGINFYQMIVADVLHEVELGIWKSLFLQVLRLLDTIDKSAANKVDLRSVPSPLVAGWASVTHECSDGVIRYRAMPTFGRDTIRRFRNNISELKQLAARDFEDLLQCAIPVFESLLPGVHNDRLMELLFIFAQWHGLAKLRLHTEHTVDMLDHTTTLLGQKLRDFVSHTCSAISTKELQREYEARRRRESKKNSKTTALRRGEASNQSKAKGKGKGKGGAMDNAGSENVAEGEAVEEAGSGGRQEKTLNLNTPKFHALGHVVPNIRLFGTTDSYTGRITETNHKVPKQQYGRTNKKDFPVQISRLQGRQASIHRIRKRITPTDPDAKGSDEFCSKYFIGISQTTPWIWLLFYNPTCPSCLQGFVAKLRQHLLPRIVRCLIAEAVGHSLANEPDAHNLKLLRALATELETGELPLDHQNHQRIYIQSDRIYRHETLHINYTSYDLRREQDVINPKTPRRNVMCLRRSSSAETANERFAYACVLGVYHVNIVYGGPGSLDMNPRRFDFLWVRWFDSHGMVTDANPFALPRLSLPTVSSSSDSIGFLDPAEVLRASHIMPRFCLGRKHGDDHQALSEAERDGDESDLFGDSEGGDQPRDEPERCSHLACQPLRGAATQCFLSCIAQEEDDWCEYYVNRFVDRDMLMRYHWGLGVGHAYSHGDVPALASKLNVAPAPPTTQGGDDTFVEGSPHFPVIEHEEFASSNLGGPSHAHQDNLPIPSSTSTASDTEGETDSDDPELALSDHEEDIMESAAETEVDIEPEDPFDGNLQGVDPHGQSKAATAGHLLTSQHGTSLPLEVSEAEFQEAVQAAHDAVEDHQEAIAALTLRRSMRPKAPRRIWVPQ